VNITKAFYMQKTEVTQGQWRAVMGTSPSYFSDCGDTCPVERVSWDDIQGFLTALNAMDPGKNYRLPTEAEWEYAARAGTTGDYGGTGVLDEMGWYSGNSGGQTHPVAQKLRTPGGCSTCTATCGSG
jgi:formylglycine-generating enzyme required for sulfatase activity